MKQSETLKLAKMAAREADKQRVFALLSNPVVLGMGTLFAGLYAANHIRWDKDDTRNADVRAIAMAGAAIGSLAALGVRDKYVMGGFGLAAGVAGMDPVKFPAAQTLTENYGLGSDSRLFGASVPGVTPGYPGWEWLLGPARLPYDLLTKGKR